MTPDAINAAFELGGALLIWLNVRSLYRAKVVRGVFPPVMAFYAAWGVWNVFYYPAIGQTLSFWAGLGVVAGNLVWCALAWKYRTPRYACMCSIPDCGLPQTPGKCRLCGGAK